MSNRNEITIVFDENSSQPANQATSEEGVEVPLDRLNPDTLRNLVAEFVIREGSDSDYALDAQIEQVLIQLQSGQAKIVFDLSTKTCNIVPAK